MNTHPTPAAAADEYRQRIGLDFTMSDFEDPEYVDTDAEAELERQRVNEVMFTYFNG
jgi:hypothetical protein